MSDTAQRIAGLSPEQLSLLARRLKRGAAPEKRDRIEARARDTNPLPLSFAQRRLWFLEQLEAGGALYNITSASLLDGPLNPAAIEQSLREVARRHESLRTTFDAKDGEPAQVVAPEPAVRLSLVDLSGLPSEERERQASRLAHEESGRAFDLARGPLVRAALLKLNGGGEGSTQRHAMLFTMHHIVSDGWSLEVLRREVTALYQTFSEGRASALAELEVQYGDYAVWQRQRSKDGAVERQLAYWRKQLAGGPPELRLPTDRPRGAAASTRGTTLPVRIDKELSDALYDIGRGEGATTFMTTLALFKTLLWRYCGVGRLWVGTPVAGRVRPEVESLIGFFVNTLVVATEVEGRLSFRDVLRRVKESCLGAYANQDVPFERLVEELRPGRGVGHAPLFNVMLILQNHRATAAELPGVSLGWLDHAEDAGVRSDLDLYLRESPRGLRGHFAYSPELFDEATVERISARLKRLAECVVRDPDVMLDDLVLAEEFELPLHAPTLSGQARAPLSYHQERLWFIDQFETGNVYEMSPTYHNLPLVIRLEGDVDRAALEASLNYILERHEALRVKVVAEGGQAFQSVSARERLKLNVFELPLDAADDGALEAALEDARRPFALDRDLLLRATLFTKGARATLLVITAHHIVADADSLRVVFAELCEAYDALAAGREPSLARTRAQYTDYARAQRALPESAWEPLRFYWAWQLRGRLKALELPEDHTRPAVHTYTAARETFKLDEGLARRIRALAAETLTSARAVTLAAFKVLLHRYARQDEIVVGTSEPCRERPELARAVGPFANLVVLRSDLSGNPTFAELLARTSETLARAHAHRELPFDKLVQELSPEKDMSRTALFDVLFRFEETATTPSALGGAGASVVETNLGHGKYDLNLLVCAEDETFAGELVFNSDIYERFTVRQMLAHFEVILEALTRDAGVRVDDLKLLSAEEERRQLFEWNSTRASYPRGTTIHQLFEEQARKTPLRAAVTFEGRSLTYAELDARANRLARHLRARGVERGALVALCLKRSAETIVALLAVLKAGAAYLPLEPAHPEERLRFMLEDSGATHLITTRPLADSLPESRASLVLLDEEDAVITSHPSDAPEDTATDEDLAYVIYTSGSTGRPKGVLVEHRNVVRLLVNDRLPFEFSEQDVWTMFHSYCFDFSVWEMYGALLYGGRLVVVSEETTKDPALFVALLAREGVTVLNQTPTAFDGLAQEALTRSAQLALRYVIFGGEALHPVQLAEWRRAHPSTLLVNMYGITETTVHVTFKEVGEGEIRANVSNVGRPLPDTTAYVLDERQRLLPVGVPGEVCVGGGGVARGYLGREELTRQKFVPNPYDPSERLYRSGDLAKLLPGGELVYLGRLDDQVQIRGFRVEPGEIRSRLLEHERVAKAEVIASKSRGETYELIAYVVPSAEVSVAELRGHLSGALPHYMVPAAFVLLNDLPLTPNGKVDRRALPAPDAIRQGLETEYVAPATQVEETLCGIWCAVLGLERVGVNDNFFELGGHSLLATQVVSRVRDSLGVELPLRSLFESPTVAGLAENVCAGLDTPRESRADVVKTHTLRPVARGGDLPLSYAQQRLWFLSQLEPDSAAYNVPFATRLRGSLNASAIEQALSEVTRRHESLRTSFPNRGGQPVQLISDSMTPRLSVVDLSQLPKGKAEELARQLAADEASLPFDLASGPMLRATLMKLGGEESGLLLTMHHIVSDGWSVGVLSSELTELYKWFAEGEASKLEELRVQYADYAVWQRERLSGESLEAHLAYWRERLADVRALELPTDRARALAPVPPRAGAASLLMPSELSDSLKALSLAEGCSLFMTTLAAFQTLLGWAARQQDVAVGTDIAGRNVSEIESLIGFFVNQLVLRTDLSGDPTFLELLGRVRESVLGAYAHQEMPFDRLVEALRPRRERGRTPLFDVKLVLQNAPKGSAEGLKGLDASSLGVGSSTAKFDLLLDLTETTRGLYAECKYNAELYDATTVTRLLERFGTLLRLAAEEPGARLSALAESLERAERQRLIAKHDALKGFGRRRAKS